MPSLKRTPYPAWAYGPLGGAALAVALAFAYAALFIMYATLRASLLVIRVNPDAGVAGTVVAYFFTLAIPALVIAAMMVIPAAVVGLVAAPLLTHIIAFSNPQHSERRAVAVSLATCFVVVAILLVAFQRVLGFTAGNIAANPETFLLWFALPALIFIAAGAAAGRELNRMELGTFRRKESTQSSLKEQSPRPLGQEAILDRQ